MANPEPAAPEVIRRHAVAVRVTHWVNALVMLVLLLSGLQIFNAHPRLYWGEAGTIYDRAWLSIRAEPSAEGLRGVTRIGVLEIDTTGFLGASDHDGRRIPRAWPAWLTMPSWQDLATGRRWHFLAAWALVVNGLIYWTWTVGARHLQRDLWPTRNEVRGLGRSVVDHLRLRHPTGENAKRYNVLQKVAYLSVIAVLGPMIVLTGLTMSPGINAAAPWLLDLFGGRQSARSLHFLAAAGIVFFTMVHLVEVLLAGPVNEIGSMITGRYVVRRGKP